MNGLVPNTQRKGGGGNRKEQFKRKNKKQHDWTDRQTRQDSKKKEWKKPKRSATDSQLSENQRLIEEGLKAQREKDAVLKLENQLVTQQFPITNSILRTDSLQRYKQQLYQIQQDLLFYQGAEDNSLPNLLKQFKRSETSFHQQRTSAWSIHHRNYRSLYPVLCNRFKAINSFPIRSSRAQLSFHPTFGYLVSAIGCLKYVSLSGVLIGEITVQDQYHSIYWNQFDQKLGILAAISDYSITFYRIGDNYIEMINQVTFERNVENFHWLNDYEGITIIHDQIHKFTIEFPQSLLLLSVSPDMIDLRIEKQFFRYKQATVSIIITFHKPQANSHSMQHQQLLLGLRNGSILLYDMIRGHGEVLHHMPYRITQLYQLKNNPLQYIAKDVSGNISLFDIRHRNCVSLVIRELNRIRLDLCTFYLTDDEEFLITSPGPVQIKQQSDQNTLDIQYNSTAARINTTINQDERKTIFSIYSLRHSSCSVFEVQASSFSEENSHQIPFNKSELILPSNSPCNARAILVREVNFINLLIYA